MPQLKWWRMDATCICDSRMYAQGPFDWVSVAVIQFVRSHNDHSRFEVEKRPMTDKEMQGGGWSIAKISGWTQGGERTI